MKVLLWSAKFSGDLINMSACIWTCSFMYCVCTTSVWVTVQGSIHFIAPGSEDLTHFIIIIIIIIIISVTELDHLLTHSGLTYPEVSSKVYHDSFYQLGSSVSLPWVIYFEAFYLHVVSSFSCIPVICPKLVLFLTPLLFVHLFCNLSQVYSAVLLMYFISAAVFLLASVALIVQVSPLYNKTGRASVLYSFILVFLRVLLWSKHII